MYKKGKIIFVLSLLSLSPVLFSQSQKYKGYPDKNPQMDILPGFVKPPKGYGNVPFFWWNGDSLQKDRMREELEILSSSATDGFAVSYLHLDPEVDSEEMKDGYGLFGKTEPGRPKVFSKEWWDIWQWFTGLCGEKGIGLGMDDYTVGWRGNGYYTDELDTLSKFRNYQGELDMESITTVEGKTNFKTKASYIIHPDHGKELIKVYFDRFEQHNGAAAASGMNYFFQDELYYPLKIGSWSEDFPAEFLKRKGYDILPYLLALKENIGPITPRIRLDYCEVLTQLAEERYFKPIYEWIESRGLIYGSDNLGRGKEPLAYVDYFRANSWYTAPGNDAPSKGSSFLQTKVSASISHLYNRPRTWLEAFHSMGWGSSGSWLTKQMDHHFMAGGNLVCMHGLYYSTHGGWWEWAPPCFHFRMPYWPHVKKWLEYTERLSFLMSQGNHVCDIALMYPTESMQAYPDAEPDVAFDLAMKLSNAGLDYDFMDYQSLQRSVIQKGIMSAGDEQYKIIILADMKALHHASLLKILEHYRSGGIVLATGELPRATTRTGENDEEVDAMIRELFGLTPAEAKAGKSAGKQTNRAGGVGLYISNEQAVAQIRSLITPDFLPEGGDGKVLHRRAGQRDIYMVMDVPKGSECFFRTIGKVELWDASSGQMSDYPVVRQTEQGTWLTVEKESSNSSLFVFSPGKPRLMDTQKAQPQLISQIAIDGDWEVELLPTMNNKWGDFRFPASDEMIGAEARSFRHQPDSRSGENWMQPDFDDSGWPESIYQYGPQAIYYSVPSSRPIESAVEDCTNNLLPGVPYEFSWQYGVWDNPGSQGWHGLKGKVSNGFFILNQGCHQLYKTHVYAPQKGIYKVTIDSVRPDYLLIDGKNAGEKVQLSKGWHSLLIAYANTGNEEFEMEKGSYRDFRKRSAVVLFPETSLVPDKPSAYEKIISTRWNLGNHLWMDPNGGKDNRWNYRFQSVPGLKEMELTLAGKKLRVWFNGTELPKTNIRTVKQLPGGSFVYQVLLNEVQKTIGTVAFSVERETGYQGAAVVMEPVKLKTGIGLLKAGDWSKTGALRYYSGGMYYRKTINVDFNKSTDRVVLDLGAVTASCEVKIKGQPVGILMSPPYTLDITSYLTPGINAIEILVYSTLSNHYQTIPTPYRGDGEAGLLGPVTFSIYK